VRVLPLLPATAERKAIEIGCEFSYSSSLEWLGKTCPGSR
jgi:hypothetical protein